MKENNDAEGCESAGLADQHPNIDCDVVVQTSECLNGDVDESGQKVFERLLFFLE